LLAAPPERGELQEQLKSLAAKKWHHPITGQWVQFGLSTIERWAGLVQVVPSSK
jgi:putative transposase